MLMFRDSRLYHAFNFSVSVKLHPQTQPAADLSHFINWMNTQTFAFVSSPEQQCDYLHSIHTRYYKQSLGDVKCTDRGAGPVQTP